MNALCLYPATPGWGVQCGFVCLSFGFGCASPLLARMLGCVCVYGRASLVPRHSWLGCALWVCVLGLGFRLSPATSGWGVWVCVSVCSVCLYPTFHGCGLCYVDWVLPGTCSSALVRCGLRALPGFAAPGGRCCLAPVPVPWLWPAACLSGVPCGPALVRRASSGPVALGALIGFPDAVVPFLHLGAYAPRITGRLRGAREGRPRNRLVVPAVAHCQGSGAGLAARCTRSGPRDGVVAGGSLRCRSLAACAAVVGVCGPGDASGFPYSPSFDGGLGRCPGLFCVKADTALLGSEDATPGSRACVRVRARLGRVGQAGLQGPFWCASALLSPFVVRSLFAWPPLGWSRPFPFVRVRCLCLGCLGPWRLFAPFPPPGFLFWFFSFCLLWPLFFVFFVFCFPRLFFFSPCAPVVPVVSCFPTRGALGLGALLSPRPPPFFCFFFLPPSCWFFFFYCFSLVS